VTKFQLRFSLDAIPHWAARYCPSVEEEAIERDLAPAVRARGYLTYDELVALGRWKSPRITPRIAANEPGYVETVTAVALTTTHERLRIEVLLLLSGVSWPMASVILHWGHRDPYPILDYRALWSLGHDTPPHYDFALWRTYTTHCREVAKSAGVMLRTLDKALWQYSKENQ
jgi:hypothetical protein